MTKYNIIYNKQYTLLDVIADLQARGVTINSTFEHIGVINISSNSMDFTGSTYIVMYEIDSEVIPTPSFEWHQQRIVQKDLPLNDAYNPLSKGNGVTVYLVDSGINTTHSEFVDASVINLHSYDGTFFDPSGHGTAVASLIVGKTLGVSTEVTLKNVKIGVGTVMSISQILEAFNAILADNPTSVSVINCSWTISKSQLLDTKILELQSAGFVVVASAGNQLQAADNFSPVGLNTVLGVAASDRYDRVITWGVGAGSNWGPEVDITAPGINVMIALNDGTIGTTSGTSGAAAIVSAVVAQFIATHPSLTAQQVQNLVLSSATEDILFRNESIYGTTPNRLLKTLYMGGYNVWDVPLNTLFPAKREEQTTITLTANYPSLINSVEYIDVNKPSLATSPLPWISATTENGITTLTVSPDATVQPNKYRIHLTVTATDGTKLIPFYTIGVYTTSPSELDQIQTEVYLVVNETGQETYLVVPSLCYGPGDCDKFLCCIDYVCRSCE